MVITKNLYLLIMESVFIFILLSIAFIIFKVIILKRLEKIALHTKNHLDDMLIEVVESISWFFYISLALFLSLLVFDFSGILQKSIDIIFLIILTLQIIKSSQVPIKYSTEKFIINYKKTHKNNDIGLILLLSKMFRVSLWFIGLLLILSNIGYNITSLLAGLGIGGIAVALAVQNILDDIFSSFSIYFDKPFIQGDYIVIGKESGIVKKIGIKTTRLQTLQGEELIVSNKDLTSARIQNFKRMEKRRIIFKLEVDQEETPIAKIKLIPKIIEDIIIEIPHTDIERVHLKKVIGQRLVFETAYTLRSSDYKLYLDIHQEINFSIIEKFEEIGIILSDKLDFLDNN